MKEGTVAVLDAARCTGCCACANACPTNAISMLQGAEGFSAPVIDEAKCIACGKCVKSCPVLTPLESADSRFQEVYAAWSLDDDIRFESTSGGAFSEFALAWLALGGSLCGACYGEGQRVEHIVVDSKDGLAAIRQSKYAQSDIGDCYRQIRDALKHGRRMLFCGSPCQCAGLISYLGGRPEGLFVVNFVCRGINSPKAFASFLSWLEGCYGSKVSRVWFKNKVHGWNRFSTRVEFKNGRVYSKDRYHDLFMRGYIEQNLYMRECCHACEFRNLAQTADVTLADFWGVKLEDASRNIDLGTSLVVINSERGRELFEMIRPRLFWEQKTIEEAFSGNACMAESPKPNPMRTYFLSHLGDVPFDELCRECFKEPPALMRSVASAKRAIGALLRKCGIRR